MSIDEEEILEVRLIDRDPVGQLPPLDWLAWPETKALVAALTAEGGEVRFVGGCVRDSIAKRPVKDIDAATPMPPEEVIRLLEAAGLKAVPTGIDHGTVTAVADHRPFEVTTLRKDVETYGRHAKVEFTDDWIEDARRRDFTINAMSCSPDGAVYDPFEGMRDLAHGIIRFVGRADERIQEDYLRILRFFRFYADYGRPPADKHALTACRKHAASLASLSGERIQGELLRILLAPDPAGVCVLMRSVGVFDAILPEAGDVTRLRLMNWLSRRAVVMESVKPDAVRNLAALLDTDGEGAAAIAARLRLSNRDTERLVNLSAPYWQPTVDTDPHDLERALHREGPEEVRDLALLAWCADLERTAPGGDGDDPAARRLPSQRTEAWLRILEACEAWQGVIFPLRGRDVLALGIPPGPKVGDLLSRVEIWWEDGRFRADREACLAQLKAVAAEDP